MRWFPTVGGSHSILGNPGQNPLSIAAWGGYQMEAELILTNRAHRDIVDTELMSTTAYGRYPAVCLLPEAAANPDVGNSGVHTTWPIAAPVTHERG